MKENVYNSTAPQVLPAVSPPSIMLECALKYADLEYWVLPLYEITAERSKQEKSE